jgi:hypothetical protein
VYAASPGNDSWGAEHVPVLKYLPLELAAVATVFFAASGSRRPVHWTVRSYQLLMLFMFAGAVLTLARGARIEDSVLGRALGLVVVYPAYRMFSSRDETRRFAQPYLPAIILTGLAMTAMLVVWQSGTHFVDQPHIFHEEVFIPAAGMLAAWIAFRDPVIRATLVGLLLGGVLLTRKNTGYLAALSCLAITALALWSNRRALSVRTRAIVRVMLVILALATVAALATIVLWFAELLPSGSPKVRVITYAIRLGQFIGSPLFGKAWIGTPLIELSPTFREPSHSDVLDIAAFGGLVSVLLFCAPLVSYARRARQDLVIFSERRHWLGAFLLAVLIVFLVEMTFNPIWNQPQLVVHFWLAIGFFAARAQQRKDQSRVERSHA